MGITGSMVWTVGGSDSRSGDDGYGGTCASTELADLLLCSLANVESVRVKIEACALLLLLLNDRRGSPTEGCFASEVAHFPESAVAARVLRVSTNGIILHF